jgi:hypothetical protein
MASVGQAATYNNPMFGGPTLQHGAQPTATSDYEQYGYNWPPVPRNPGLYSLSMSGRLILFSQNKEDSEDGLLLFCLKCFLSQMFSISNVLCFNVFFSHVFSVRTVSKTFCALFMQAFYENLHLS